MSFLLSAEDKEKIIAALNDDLSGEIGAIVQYVNHHVMVAGLESPAIAELFEKTSKDEMEHMEKLAERIDYLGGGPTTKMAEIKMGGDIRKMVKDDLDSENDAIKRYKEHIKLVAEIGDTTTRLMLEQILTDEENHAYQWETVLAEKK